MIDERAIPPAGRIGETEDLIGSVFVKDGKVCYLSTFTNGGSHEKGEENNRGRGGASVSEERGANGRWSQRRMMLNPLTDLSRVMAP
jgi:hypothetical protein